MSSEFKIKDLGEAQKILGMEIVKDREKEKISMTQKALAKDTLKVDTKIVFL